MIAFLGTWLVLNVLISAVLLAQRLWFALLEWMDHPSDYWRWETSIGTCAGAFALNLGISLAYTAIYRPEAFGPHPL